MKRLIDILSSFFGIVILSPFAVLIGIIIKLDSKGPVFYNQIRIGKNGVPFHLHKLRTMIVDADKLDAITIGTRDPRITPVGYWLRKFKLDEFPQLLNVLKGEMSLVGPRPEIPIYVKLYSNEQLRVLEVRPGISDWASLRFRNENELLSKVNDWEKFYVNEIMPAKINMNLDYIERQSLWNDLKIILLSVFPFLRSRTVNELKSKHSRNLEMSADE